MNNTNRETKGINKSEVLDFLDDKKITFPNGSYEKKAEGSNAKQKYNTNQENMYFKKKILSFQKILKEKLKPDKNLTFLPKIAITTSMEFSNESPFDSKEMNYLSRDLNFPIEEQVKNASFYQKNKIIPNNIKMKNFKPTIAKKCLVLSCEKFVF